MILKHLLMYGSAVLLALEPYWMLQPTSLVNLRLFMVTLLLLTTTLRTIGLDVMVVRLAMIWPNMAVDINRGLLIG